MELLHFSSFPILLLSLSSIFLFICLSRKSRGARPTPSKLPPGPRKLPLIGNLHNLASSFPHHALRDLSDKYGPLMSLQLGEVPAVVVSSPEIAKEIMKTHDLLFSSRPVILASEILSYGSKDLVFAPYGELWRQLRKICTLELLSLKRVKSFGGVRGEEYTELVKWIASNSGVSINLSEKIYSASYGNVSRVAFGGVSKDHEEFTSVVKEVLPLSSGFSIGDLFPSYKLLHKVSRMRPQLERLQRKADRIMEGIIQDHRNKLGQRKQEDDRDDIVDVLLKYEGNEDGGFTLSMENVKGVILDVFAAGSDTSATTVDWALAELVKNRTILEKVQAEVRGVFDVKGRVEDADLAELKFLKMVIKETLRMHPPLPLSVPRECRKKCEINGYEIPEKTKVIINGWAISRDPRYWKDAETFDPERFRENTVDFKGTDFEFTPFGAGRRMCPGMNFALANIEFPLAMLLYHFDWELPQGMKSEDMDMTELFSVTGQRKANLFLIPKVYRGRPASLIRTKDGERSPAS